MDSIEKEILDTFSKVIPILTPEQRQHLLWFGEGLAFRKESNKTAQHYVRRRSHGKSETRDTGVCGGE